MAKDEKKGFNELRRACDESLADGALDDTTSQSLDAKQRKDMNVGDDVDAADESVTFLLLSVRLQIASWMAWA